MLHYKQVQQKATVCNQKGMEHPIRTLRSQKTSIMETIQSFRDLRSGDEGQAAL